MIPPLLAILVWPLVSIVFFQRLRLPLAILVTLVGGFLVLPVRTGLNLPGLPELDKDSVPALTALVLAAVFAARDRPTDLRPDGLIPRHPLVLILLAMLVGGAAMTAVTNGDVLRYGARVLPALRAYDAGSMALSAVVMVIPFVLARRYLADPAAQRLLLMVIAVAAVIYAFPALFEARMSPQLNRWVYGFFPHSWVQHIRGGAFRPLVFLNHGLVLGIFLAMALLAAVALVRIDARRRWIWLAAALWIGLTLMLSRNLGAVMITAALLPVMLLLGVRLQLLVAAVVAGLFLLYPVVRVSQILPIERVIAFAESIDPQRAGSLVFRLNNEEDLLAKASQRPLFGWGGWGRSRVYDETGTDTSVTDGVWIIRLGVDGWVGYIGRFGLLTVPVFLLLLHRRRYDVGPETAALTIVLAANLIDMVPNSSNIPLTWVLAGALWGRLELKSATRPDTAGTTPAPVAPSYRGTAAAGAVSGAVSGAASGAAVYTRQTRRFVRAKPAVTR